MGETITHHTILDPAQTCHSYGVHVDGFMISINISPLSGFMGFILSSHDLNEVRIRI